MKKITGIILLLLAVIILSACQANYIRDVQGGTVSPSSTAEVTGLATSNPKSSLTKTKRVRLILMRFFFEMSQKFPCGRWDLKSSCRTFHPGGENLSF
nr:protein hic [Escherichia coli]